MKRENTVNGTQIFSTNIAPTGTLPSDYNPSNKLRAARFETISARDQIWDRLAPVIFLLFAGCLITLLILSYADVPLV